MDQNKRNEALNSLLGEIAKLGLDDNRTAEKYIKKFDELYQINDSENAELSKALGLKGE